MNHYRLVAAFKDSRKRFRMEDLVLPTGESSARRPRTSAVLAPRDMNVPVASKEDSLLSPKYASILKITVSSGCALPSGPSASADDADQPAIEAAKLFVSQLKYKDLQQELKVFQTFKICYLFIFAFNPCFYFHTRPTGSGSLCKRECRSTSRAPIQQHG